MSQAIQPATIQWQKKDPLMEELERKMSEMTAHIADLRRDLPRGPPRRQQTYTIQQRGNRQDGCYLCGKLGHFARDCRTRSWREGKEREEQRHDRQVNMIEEVELVEEETYPIEETYPAQATRPRQYARRTPY